MLLTVLLYQLYLTKVKIAKPPLVSVIIGFMDQKPSYKAIGFDLGGVIVAMSEQERFMYWAAELHMDPVSVAEAWRACAPALERGDSGIDKFWQDLEKQLKRPIDPDLRPTLWGHHTLSVSSVRPEMLKLVEDLKGSGYRVGILSNIYASDETMVAGRDLFEHFDFVGLSNRLHAAKPEPAAYQALVEGLGATPETTIFVDDLAENVAGAEAVGIKAFEFIDSQQLFNDLSGVGIVINSPAAASTSISSPEETDTTGANPPA